MKDKIEKCIKSTAEKFWRQPYNFFTESDAHSYLYYYIFRFGSSRYKTPYPTKDKRKTVLIHREYPTSFRYRKKNMKQLKGNGGRGHYDLVVLNPKFMIGHDINEIIAQTYKKCKKDESNHLLAAIEFKLVTKSLDKGLRSEIKKDFKKLRLALSNKQAISAFMIIFNRANKNEKYHKEFQSLTNKYPEIKAIYVESVFKPKRYAKPFYSANWKHKIHGT